MHEHKFVSTRNMASLPSKQGSGTETGGSRGSARDEALTCVEPSDNAPVPSATPSNPALPPSTTSSSDESLNTRIERLGRQRPPLFPTLANEIFFVFSITMSQFLTEFFVSGFTVLLPTLIHELSIPQASAVWPATAFSLVIAATLLVFGRLGDMLGGFPVFIAGLGWLLVWSIVAGFSVNPLMLDLCRALQGLGAAAFLPTGVMLMGSVYRPGPRKNLVFAIYGTSAVLGFFGGIAVAGVVGEYVRWGWYFWIGGSLAGVTLISSLFSVPKLEVVKGEDEERAAMDWLGAVTTLSGLTLTIFAITESAHAADGWRTPYIPVIFAIGIVALFAAWYVETRVATQPLLPASLFAIPSMTSLLFAIFLLYGTWGIFSVYGTIYFQTIMMASPLQVVAWYIPLGVVGLLMSILEGLILHIVPGKALLILSGLGALGSQLLIALIPISGGSYWPWIFPATILGTIGIDVATILMTVFVTTKVPANQQGLAGGVVNCVLQLGVAFILGFADIIQSTTVHNVGLAKSYKNTFWLGVAAGAVSLVVMTIWSRVPAAKSELTVDERTKLFQEGEGVDRAYGASFEGCSR